MASGIDLPEDDCEILITSWRASKYAVTTLPENFAHKNMLYTCVGEIGGGVSAEEGRTGSNNLRRACCAKSTWSVGVRDRKGKHLLARAALEHR